MFTQVSEERALKDALNYGPELNAASPQLIAEERNSWYALLPDELKDQPPTDPRESLAQFFYDEADQTMAIAQDANLGRDKRQLSPVLETMAAEQYRRVHARIAISRLVRAAFETDVAFSNEQDQVAPEDVSPILDFSEKTPEQHHSLIVDGTLAEQLFEEPNNLDDLLNRWFYDSRLGIYVQVASPSLTEHARNTLRQAIGSDEGIEAALADKVQLNAYMGAAAVRASSFKRNT